MNPSRIRRGAAVTALATLLMAATCLTAAAQPQTILPRSVLDGLANAVSGSRALANLNDFTGYNRDRTAEEFAGTWLESRLFSEKAREYGFSDVEVLKYPRAPLWDGIRGELWVTSPVMRKIADFKDMPTVLAPGSTSGTWEGELVWVDQGASPDSYPGKDVAGKIVLTEASTGGAYSQATRQGALGVVNMNVPRPSITPDAVMWSSIRVPDGSSGFAFNINAFMTEDLKRLLGMGPVGMKVVVESAMRDVDNEVITAVIPGDGSTDEWVYYSAHVFEGVNKQGAADDGSGAVIILEAGRTLLEAIQRGTIQRPARNLRFIWVDEFSGTYAFLDSHQEEFARCVADINIDMAGQNVTLNNNATRLYRMPDSRIHYLADVAQEFFEWVGTTNMERVHERRGGYAFSYPITDPYGTQDAWRYVIEPFYGSSDHQVYNDRGVPAVLFNHWPDMVYHTSHDRPKLMDATQMKRSAFIGAATGLIVAGSPDADPVVIASDAFDKSRQRIASDLGEWMVHMSAMADADLPAAYRDTRAALAQWYEREDRNVASVLELTRGSTTTDPKADAAVIGQLRTSLADAGKGELTAFDAWYERLCAARGVRATRPQPTAAERAAARMIPAKTGADGRARAQGLPGFSGMEVLNFIDGKRSVLEIRDAVNSEYALEYGTIQLDAVVGYVRALAEAGMVTIAGGA